MTPADEATFIALWQQGLSQDAIAQQLGCPVGTVKSRAHALAHQGKLQARPRGGASPHRRARARQDGAGVSADTPGVSTRVSGHTPLPAERGQSVRWNLHLSEQLRTCIKVRAKARGLQDSQMVEELCWLALSMTEEADPH
jgi:hypothetical protein